MRFKAKLRKGKILELLIHFNFFCTTGPKQYKLREIQNA